MNKNKRMIYIYDDNIDTYDDIENKSEWINGLLREIGKGEQLDIEKEVNKFEERLKAVHGRRTTDDGTK